MPLFLPQKVLSPFLQATFPRRRITARPLSGGLLNQNFIVDVVGRRYVAKVYRQEMTAKQLSEIHRIMNWVRPRQVPTPLVIATDMIKDHQVAVYEFIPGRHPSRYRVDPITMRAMGRMLGLIHRTLDRCRTTLPKKSVEELMTWNSSKFLIKIRQLRRTARRLKIADVPAFDRHLDIYEHLVRAGDWSDGDFMKLPLHLCHGDFHGKNILIHGHTISGVLDWEKCAYDWRGYEIMRSIIFNCRRDMRSFDWRLVKAYLRGYRDHVVLTDHEKRSTFECGYRRVLFSLWGEEEFLHGHTALAKNMQRRAQLLPVLHRHRQEYADRIAELLR